MKEVTVKMYGELAIFGGSGNPALTQRICDYLQVPLSQADIVDFPNESRLNRVDITNANFNTAQTVTFDCLGSPLDGGTVTLQADGNTKTITVEPITGFISIQ